MITSSDFHVFSSCMNLLVKEPLPLIIHHLPIAVTFAFFDNGKIVAVDPTHYEEAVMGGRMTTTLNSNGDVCAVQKAGGEGIIQSMIMQCLRIASVKATDITSKIKNSINLSMDTFLCLFF
ncbi:hypothetical protein NE237_000277 [Protea cynaroides]|uniref:Exoribonuclease phosphorolytic domain-containing protein n=1 Tax=Protea cynaroides TaxID=273540 RepID=A0A9Q0KRY1_9MAGN|nr:hypothetical protein NE237_000277 [Protea cynaroides]